MLQHKKCFLNVFLGVFAVIFFIASIVSVVHEVSALDSAGTLIFERALFNKDSFTAENNAFVLHLENDARVVISTPDQPMSIYKADCADYNVTRICYNESNFDSTRREMKATIRVYSIKPKIQIFRETSISAQNIYAGQQFSIVVWINNTGYSTAHIVKFRDDLPDGLNITASSCTKSGNSITAEGDINAGEGFYCEYTARPIAEMNVKQKAMAEFYDGTKVTEAYSEPLTITSLSTVEYVKSTEKNSIYAGETTNLTINVTNRNPKETRINFSIILPQSLEGVDDSGRLKKEETSLLGSFASVHYWSTPLYENQTDQLTMRIIGRNTGHSEAVIKTVFGNDDGSFSLKDEKIKFEVKGNPVRLYSNLDQSAKYESGYSYPLLITLENPSNFLSCRNAQIGFETDLTKLDNYTLDHINSSSIKYIINTRFIAPRVEKETNYPFKTSVNCSTDYGEAYAAELTKSARVARIEALSISHVLSTSSVEGSREVSITTNVKNPRAVPIEAEIEDIIDSELIPGVAISTGRPYIKATINKDSTLSAYSYVITAPRISQQKTYIINTTAFYIDNITGEPVQSYKEQVLTVVPKQLKLSYSRRVMDDNVYSGKFLKIRHEVTNSDTEPVKNLVITIPAHQETDIRGERQHFLKNLNPGETVTLDVENVKVKKELQLQQLRLDEVTLQYEDKQGFEFNQTFAPLTIGMQQGNAADTMPSLYMVKILKLATQDTGMKTQVAESVVKRVVVTILLENKGLSSARNIIVKDLAPEFGIDKNWSLELLKPGEKIQLEYSVPVSSIPISAGSGSRNIFFPRAIAEYWSEENAAAGTAAEKAVFYTASNDATIEVTKTVQDEIVSAKEDGKEKEVKIAGTDKEAITEEKAKKPEPSETGLGQGPSEAPSIKAAGVSEAPEELSAGEKIPGETQEKKGLLAWLTDFLNRTLDALKGAFGGGENIE